MKKSKGKIFWGMCLFLYWLFVLALSVLFSFLYTKITGETSDLVTSILIAVVCLFTIPPVLLAFSGFNIFEQMFSKSKKEERKVEKEKKKEFEEAQRSESFHLREKFHLPEYIYTTYEIKKKYPLIKHRYQWVLLVIFETSCFVMVIGGAVMTDFMAPDIGFLVIFIGLIFGIYGFFALLQKFLKGILYSFPPVLCFALPLAFGYYVIHITPGWELGLLTVGMGGLLFSLFMIFAVNHPTKKRNQATSMYLHTFTEKNKTTHFFFDSFEPSKAVTLWLDKEHFVELFEFEKGKTSISVVGNVQFNGILLTRMPIDYFESEEPFDDCVTDQVRRLGERVRLSSK